MAKKALLIIDMLNDFIEEKGALYCGNSARAIIPNIKQQIDIARDKNIHIIYVCDNHQEDDSEFKLFKKHCVKDTWGAEIIKELKPQKEDVIIYKRRFSAFFQTHLDLSLREKNITHLILCGVCTNICVLYTAADAAMLGYNVTILKNAVASFNEEAHKFALEQMKNVLGCKIV